MEVTGVIQLVGVLVCRVQDSFIPHVSWTLRGWLWARCIQVRLRPDDGLRVSGLFRQSLRLTNTIQKPQKEAAELQKRHHWQSQNSLLLQSLHHANHLNPAQIRGKTPSLNGRSSTDVAVIFDLPQRSMAHLCQCSPGRQISGEPEATEKYYFSVL